MRITNSMRLEIADFPVRKIHPGNSHRYEAGTLEVDQQDLVRLVLQDRRIYEAKFDTASPGEPVRITGIRDVVEPRAKFGVDAQVFPGIIAPVQGVDGCLAYRLAGMTVVSIVAYEGRIRAGTGVQRSAILDMWGPGAAASRFGSLAHLVLIMRLQEGLGELDVHGAIQK